MNYLDLLDTHLNNSESMKGINDFEKLNKMELPGIYSLLVFSSSGFAY